MTDLELVWNSCELRRNPEGSLTARGFRVLTAPFRKGILGFSQAIFAYLVGKSAGNTPTAIDTMLKKQQKTIDAAFVCCKVSIMRTEDAISLSRRERQIMDILYRFEAASGADVQRELPDPPSYSATRALLAVLVKKGHVVYSLEGNKYIYRPREPKKKAGSSAMKRVVNTFYEGSLASAVVGLLESSEGDLSQKEIDRLAKLIREAEKKSSADSTKSTSL